MQQQTVDQYLLTLPCFRQQSCHNIQTVLTAMVMSSPHTHTEHTLFLTLAPSPLHTETLCPETKEQVKVDKRCLWIFWVTHSKHCLHSPCNYLLTDIILAVKWLAKIMCTQKGPENKVVHAVYLLAPSYTWCTAICKPDRKLLSLTLPELNHKKHNACLYTQKQTRCICVKLISVDNNSMLWFCVVVIGQIFLMGWNQQPL